MIIFLNRLQSIAFHENGKNHKFNASKRIDDIRRRGTQNDRQSKKEEQWIRQMEEAAMNDYRTKDLGSGSDISARVFNERKAEKDAQKKMIEEAAEKAKAKMEEEKAAGAQYSIGPQIPGTSGAAASSESGLFKPVEAPKDGTKWHKSAPKKW